MADLRRSCPNCQTNTTEFLCPQCGFQTRLLADAMDPLMDSVLEGRYRIVSRIGVGGMGSVYRAVQLSTEQTVAVKVIRPEFGEMEIAVKRFRREAKAASLLRDPHTVRLIDFGETAQGSLFLVMEFLQGLSLGDLLKKVGVLPEGRILKIAMETAQSLAEAHEAGVVHRDLKPANIMLVETMGDADFVKVVDFGTAKFVAGVIEASKLTPAGEVIGTPFYIAPEITTGGSKATYAADVYSLGVTVFQAVAGRVPFRGKSTIETLLAHSREPIPDIPEESNVTEGLKKLVKRMLSKDPDIRPSSRDLVGEIGGLLAGIKGEQIGRIPSAGVVNEAATERIARTDRWPVFAVGFFKNKWGWLALSAIGVFLVFDLLLILWS